MATRHDPADEPFFREWQQRQPNERRSLDRASQLKTLLDLENVSLPILSVVGSKGKGTIAVYASATLTAAGLCVGTLTSPSMLSNRERIRVAGSSILPQEYNYISQRLSALLHLLPPRHPGDGYLAPTGLFTLAAVRHFIDSRCDVMVLEAGMGGRSDEVSLFPPTVLAVGSIFGEHIGLLGANPSEIAEEKIGIATNETRSVLSMPQTQDVSIILEKAVGKQLRYLDSRQMNARIIDKLKLPPGFSRGNAILGITAGLQLAQECGINSPSSANLRRVISTVSYPGRLSVHNVRGAQWVLDAAVDERGVATALEWCKRNVGYPDQIFVSFPDSKDVSGAQRAVYGYEYLAVRFDAPHLKYSSELWPKPLISVEEVSTLAVGKCVLMVGTMSFIAYVLDIIGANLEHLYKPLPHES